MHGTVPSPRPPRFPLPRAAQLYVRLPRVAYLSRLPDDEPIPGLSTPTMPRSRPARFLPPQGPSDTAEGRVSRAAARRIAGKFNGGRMGRAEQLHLTKL